MSERVYLSPPHMGPDERGLLLEAFDSNWIAPLGPHVDGFEKEFSARVQMPHAAALSSGTAALHLSLQLLGVGRGDEVLVSSLTFAASANPITYLGARPVFIDSENETWNLDPALLEAELKDARAKNRPVKAVIAVDLYGQCAQLDVIERVCAEYGVPLIEDAAEALGATWKGRQAGTFGAAAAFSFNGNKIITTSGGGMLVSHDAKLIEKARFIATQARDPAPHYQHSHIGQNYRLSNLLAAVGRGQLRVLNERIAARRAHRTHYESTLGRLPGIGFMPLSSHGEWNGWLTVITVDPKLFGASREDLRLALEKENIESRPVWKPMHLQPVFEGCRMVGGPVAERAFEFGLCLPSGSSMTAAARDRVVGIISELHRA
ncbi:MAG: pyridoxal phosphate-dependent aminotransferase [Archangium gephyra]|uniref:GDP-perosamine synthase n=1 Tax=Archangium gephyra TaxID=48 RepID=A0A2W5VEA9_9BACT|nr:MAG: pyridoxal phosphate-dependent aminotransferase [Archangium gephyra]